MSKVPAYAAKAVDCCLPYVLGIVLFCLLAVQATLAIIPSSGLYLNYALRLEGEPLGQEELTRIAGGVNTVPWASLNLNLLDYSSLPNVLILIDGQEVASFLKNEVTLNVKHGSTLVIHNPHPYAVTVRISKITPNILQPAIQSQVSGTGRLYFEPVVVR